MSPFPRPNLSMMIGMAAAVLVFVGAVAAYIFYTQFKTMPLLQNLTGQSSVTEQALTPAEVAMHNSAESCWVSYKGKVHDLTWFVSKHEGGNLILQMCGKDATSFSAQHPGGSFDGPEVQAVLKMSVIGQLVESK